MLSAPTTIVSILIATSHAAAMDYLGDFLELGEPPSVVRVTIHQFFAMQFIDCVEKEAATAFRHFLKSDDPAAVFPQALTNIREPAMLQLLDHKMQLKKLMDMTDYASGLLSQAKPVLGMPHSQSTRPLRHPARPLELFHTRL